MKDLATTQPEKLDLRSHDIAADKLAQLLRLFPEVRTEGGELDFGRLKLVLGEAVDVGKERFGLCWPGGPDPVGLILCSDKSSAVVIYATGGINTLRATVPDQAADEAIILAELERTRRLLERRTPPASPRKGKRR